MFLNSIRPVSAIKLETNIEYRIPFGTYIWITRKRYMPVIRVWTICQIKNILSIAIVMCNNINIDVQFNADKCIPGVHIWALAHSWLIPSKEKLIKKNRKLNKYTLEMVFCVIAERKCVRVRLYIPVWMDENNWRFLVENEINSVFGLLIQVINIKYYTRKIYDMCALIWVSAFIRRRLAKQYK